VGSILTLFYYTNLKNERAIIETRMSDSVESRIEMIKREFQLIISDLRFLSEQNELLEMLESAETGHREDLAAEYLSFSARKGIYDQIRFLDENGMEIVRVNLNVGSSTPSIVPVEQLQSKINRYYFKDTFILEKGEVFVSPLDLNIERGEIEQPQKQMIRFGIPVFDSEGHKRGIVVLNYLAHNMTHQLELLPDGLNQIMLLNSDGYWLHNPNPEYEWGFMYPEKVELTFGNTFPETWQTIIRSNTEQFRNADGLFTYATIYPLLEGQKSSTGSGKAFKPSAQQLKAEQYFWKLVSYFPGSFMGTGSNVLINRLLLFYAIMIVVLGGSSWMVALAVVRRKQAEEAVVRQAKGLAETNAQLEEMSLHKSKFLANMSHELRTPLNSIIGYTKLMLNGLEGDLNEEQKQDLQTVYKNSKHLLELINDLLDLSRIEAGKTVFNYSTFKISDLLSDVISTVEQLARQKELTLTCSTAPDVDSIYADMAKIKQVLINILGNAIKFTDEGSVKLEVIDADSNLIISVADTGIGIKKDDLMSVFDSFKQVEQIQISKYEGTGLGLAISKQLIEMQGGRIWAESESEKGSTFYVSLPKQKVT